VNVTTKNLEYLDDICANIFRKIFFNLVDLSCCYRIKWRIFYKNISTVLKTDLHWFSNNNVNLFINALNEKDETMQYIIFNLTLIALISGCSSTSTMTLTELNEKSVAISQEDTSKKSEKQKKLREEFDKKFTKTLETCDEKMQSLSASFTGSGKKELTLATIGIIAGSIVVPTLAAKTNAAKSTLAGWGGLSGAINAAQYTLHQKGTSASSIGAIYESMRMDIIKATNDFHKATKDKDKIEAINTLSITCRYPKLPNVPAPVKPSGEGTE